MCSTNKNTPRIMVFKPTWEEFQNFSKYIEVMESQGAHKAGIAKVIPPPEWIPRKKSYNENDIMNIDITPIYQVINGVQGIYEQRSEKYKSMKVADFKKLAESNVYKTPDHSDFEDLEKKFWNNIVYHTPLYGADVSGSITDKDVDVWNISKLETILDYLNEDYGIRIEGVNTPYLYFGMYKTTFPWHTEDMDLYSINYLHYGEPKTWYAVPPEHGHRFEKVASENFPTYAQCCPAFLRHKIIIISPQKLKKYSVPFNKITQNEREIIITFPYGYHTGFNHGFNIAESTNFASPRWVEYGKRASKCHCTNNSIMFSMDTFVKRMQPDKYELWRQGKDIGTHPEDPSRILYAPMPSKSDILCNINNKSIPKCYNETTRKRRRVNKKVSDSSLSNNKKHNNKALDAYSLTSVQKLHEKEYKDEQFNDKQ